MNQEKNRIIQVRTFAGHYYRIHENGNIQRMDMPDFKPSGLWKAVRLVKPNGSKVFSLPEVFEKAEANGFVEYESDARQNGEFILRHKNRKPKLYLMDNDYGTLRQWGDGIVSITLVREAN